MAVIECHNLYRDYAGTIVLRGVDFSVDKWEKVGLVGPNGAGKTTLLNALSGLDEDFRGTRILEPGLRIGYLSQHVEPPGDMTAVDYLCLPAAAARERLREAEEALSACDESSSRRLLRTYEEALRLYEEAGGDFAEERASRALELVGLGGRGGVKAAALSGGERGVLALAAALQGNPGLLILDEPGNHLDFWGMAWLEDFLVRWPGAAIIVSHNRMLLDRSVTRIVELEGGTARSWTGDYSSYRLQKLRSAAAQGEDWQASRKKIERLEEMVKRAAVMAAAFTKHQAKSNSMLGQKLKARRHQLEREKAKAVERPELGSSAITARFSGRGAADARCDWALIVTDYSKAFGEKVLLREAGFDILRGERVALVGPNGCGKTTFLRELVDSGSWDSPRIRVGPSMRIGYLSQDRDGFKRGRSIREEFEELGAREADIRNILRDFGFGRGEFDRPIESLSGGELNRLQLARAVWSGANFLVLDEPTNHLDLDARESVEDRLAEYDGTILLVSHDRYFIEKVADRIVSVEDGVFVPFDGGFSEFWARRGAAVAPGAVSSSSRDGEALLARGDSLRRAKSARGRETDRAGGGVTPGRAKPSSGRADAIEDAIVSLEGKKGLLEEGIKRSIEGRRFKEAKAMSNELQELHADLERLYEKWA